MDDNILDVWGWQPESDDPLSGINKDVDEVMMYCTGGIRCDVYSTMLR